MTPPSHPINLWVLVAPVLIVKAKTGVVYSNQVGGCQNDHPEVEGFLVPLTRSLNLPRVFSPDWWDASGNHEWMNHLSRHHDDGGAGYYSNEEAIAWEIESEIRNWKMILNEIKVDHTGIEEAWVECQVILAGEQEWRPAILTWNNSD